MPDQPGDHAQRASDAERLRALERRLDDLGRDQRPQTPGADKFYQANQAWRMVVELVAGLAIGFGVGYGLDRLFGTTPIMLVIFIFLGFAAGVKTMLRTAAEMGHAPPAGTARDSMPDDDPDDDERD
ncbi:AtpZ/AtpI family protein [Paracoccus sphaerophysae]|uniref:AtpZ/AtpI family protein n=1 Tax=Paracoccus sphaerophysae TaxID=690417 RepID=UPI00068E9A0F|nr:AtpZ/AtpI family protein [Paracoccus sphaerophysae]